jgi:hypothetical protein
LRPRAALHQVFPFTDLVVTWDCRPQTNAGDAARYAEHCVFRSDPSVYVFVHLFKSQAHADQVRRGLVADGRARGTTVTESTWRVGGQQAGPVLEFANFLPGALRNLGDHTIEGFYAKGPFAFTLMAPTRKQALRVFNSRIDFPVAAPDELPLVRS